MCGWAWFHVVEPSTVLEYSELHGWGSTCKSVCNKLVCGARPTSRPGTTASASGRQAADLQAFLLSASRLQTTMTWGGLEMALRRQMVEEGHLPPQVLLMDPRELGNITMQQLDTNGDLPQALACQYVLWPYLLCCGASQKRLKESSQSSRLDWCSTSASRTASF